MHPVHKLFTGLLFVLLLGGSASYAQTDASKQSLNTDNNTFRESLAFDQKEKVEVYPNPASEFIMVEIKDGDLMNIEFEMHSIIGNTIDIQPEEVASNTFKIPVKTFNTGYYFLIIKDEYTRYKKAIKFLKN